MNFFKSGWSYLSSSFTQSEGDTEMDTSESQDILEEGVDVANEQWEDSVESNEDIDFADAEGQISDEVTTVSNSQEHSMNDNLEQSTELKQAVNKEASLIDISSTETSSAMNNQLLEEVKTINVDLTEAVESGEAVKGYTSLEASDSDDSGEFIPPPAAPVGRSDNTESQLNQIIKNLGGDLGILTLEDEDHSEPTLPGGQTFGETLYLTAYDQTICAGNETVDSFSVTAVGEDLNGSTSPDSAIASTSKSSINSEESIKLNLDSCITEAKRPSTPTLPIDNTFSDTLVDPPFSDSILNTSVKETVNISQETDENISVNEKHSGNEVASFDDVSDIPIATDQNKQNKPYLKTVEKPTAEIEQQNSNCAKMTDFDDEIPISRGSYTIDFDNLDDFDPFQSKKAMCNSPDVPSKPFPASVVNEQNIASELPVKDTAISSNQIEGELNILNSVVESKEQMTAIINTETNGFSNGKETRAPVDTSTSLENLPAENKTVNKNEISSEVDHPNSTREQSQEDEGIPIPKGSYSLDFDNLGNMDPFKTSKGLQNSPTKPKAGGYNIDFDNLDLDPFASGKTLSFSPPKSPVKNNVGLLKHMNNNEGLNVLPEPEKKKVSVDDCGGDDALIIPKSDLINDVTGNLENVDPSPQIKLVKKPVLGANRKKTTQTKKPVKKKLPPIRGTEPLANEEDGIIISKGSYSINFDDLENLDPFKTSKGLSNSPTKTLNEQPSFNSSITKDEVSAPSEDSPGKGTSVDPPRLPIAKSESAENDQVQNEGPNVAKIGEVKPEEQKPKEKTVVRKKKPPAFKSPEVDGDIEVPISKGSYSLDFDNLDAMDPFKTSKGLPNSPTDKKTMDFDNIDPFKASKTIENSPPASPVKVSETEIKAVTEEVKEPEKPKNTATPPKKKKPAFKPPPVDDNNDGEIPIPKGSYNLDFDNFEAMDPFKTSKGLPNSPTDGKVVDLDPFKASKAVENSPPTTSPANVDKIELPTTIVDLEKPETPKKKSTPPKKKKPAAFIVPPTDNNEEDEIPISKGSYNLDFDNLDGMDPFKTSKGLPNSPTDKKTLDFENIDPFKSSNAVSNSPPASPSKLNDEKHETAEKSEEPKKPLKVEPDEDEIPIPKGSYNLDFDNINAMDPFKTSKGLSNSPTNKKTMDFDNVDSFKPSKAMANSPPASPTKLTLKTEEVIQPAPEETPIETKNQLEEKSTEKNSDASLKENKKPKKKAGGLARKKLVKPGLKTVAVENESSDDPPISKGAYNLDFDNLDALDPFKSSKGLPNSPTKVFPPTVSGHSVNLDDLDSIDPFKTKKSLLMDTPVTSAGATDEVCSESAQAASANSTQRVVSSVASIEDDVGPAFQSANETAYLSAVTSPTENMLVSAKVGDAPSQEILDYKKLQKMEFDKLNEDEEFYPASSVFEDSASLAYLDKLGGVKPLTESDLRKQSLYVKFDPLVSDSPVRQITEQISQDNKAKGDASNVILDGKSSGDNNNISTRQLVTTDAPSVVTEQQQIGANDLIPPSVSQATTNVSFKPTMDHFNQEYLSQQSYQTAPSTLKYTQADFENAIRSAEQEWEKERNEHKSKEETYKAEIEQMNNVVKEYERLFAEFSGNGTQGGGMTRDQKLLKAEHEQSLEDLAALERSHEDLCRRYNRLKSMVAQFKQNEDILKKSTNEVMEEAKAAEKKYISLKIEADEKIKKANAELQFVKANAQQEVARAQAQLKMLELKCESLQSQIRDCYKENEELTKLCDDLIACSKPNE